MKKSIQIALAEDSPTAQREISEMINSNPDMDLAFVAPNGQYLIDEIGKHEVDLIIMDIEMPIKGGIETTKILSSTHPDIKILCLTAFDEEDKILQMIVSGASGYILKGVSREELYSSIDEIMDGGAPMSPIIAYKILNHLKKTAQSNPNSELLRLLTDREMEILQEVKQGLSNKEIASKLFISNGTVRKHIDNIYQKLQVHNRVEAIHFLDINA